MTWRVVSIDPGAVHCGVAIWVEEQGLWTCTFAVEMGMEACIDFVKAAITVGVDQLEYQMPEVIIEGFWLKPGLDAMRQAGSEMETTEVIGAVRHLCRWEGAKFTKVANGQQAIITRLEAAGYKWTSRGHGGHAKDAEAVGVRGLGLKVRQLAVVDAKRKAEACETS